MFAILEYSAEFAIDTTPCTLAPFKLLRYPPSPKKYTAATFPPNSPMFAVMFPVTSKLVSVPTEVIFG